MFVTSEGTVKALDATTGRLTYEAALPGAARITVLGATFDAEASRPAARAAGGEPPLAQTLSSIIWDPTSASPTCACSPSTS